MSNALAKTTYQKLFDDISTIYEGARRALSDAAWQIGRRIVEDEQKGEIRAEYGTGLIRQLSEDLTRKYGAGFSITNLKCMRRYYLANKIGRPAAQLPLTSQLMLMRVKDPKARKVLEKRAIKDGLTKYDILRLAREIKAQMNGDNGKNTKPAKALPPLKRPTDLRLNTFSKSRLNTKLESGVILVDCGFFLNRPVRKEDLTGVIMTDTPSYTYPATVDIVIDGDTLKVLVDAGFGNIMYDKLRLRGIDCPELGTPEGEKAKKYVQSLLPVGSTIVIKSIRRDYTDLHGRFVVDVFYSRDAINGVSTPEEIIASGVYLNQQLLDEGYAVRMEE